MLKGEEMKKIEGVDKIFPYVKIKENEIADVTWKINNKTECDIHSFKRIVEIKKNSNEVK